jgi:hypothetical protein
MSAFDLQTLRRLDRPKRLLLECVIADFVQLSFNTFQRRGSGEALKVDRKLMHAGQRVYLHRSDSAINGMIRVGCIKLSLCKGASDSIQVSKVHEIQPFVVLDFCVHDSVQRCGIGKQLFEEMLKRERLGRRLDPGELAYDGASPKLLAFLKKHYGLFDFVFLISHSSHPNLLVFSTFNQYLTTLLHKTDAPGLVSVVYTSPLLTPQGAGNGVFLADLPVLPKLVLSRQTDFQLQAEGKDNHPKKFHALQALPQDLELQDSHQKKRSRALLSLNSVTLSDIFVPRPQQHRTIPTLSDCINLRDMDAVPEISRRQDIIQAAARASARAHFAASSVYTNWTVTNASARPEEQSYTPKPWNPQPLHNNDNKFSLRLRGCESTAAAPLSHRLAHGPLPPCLSPLKEKERKGEERIVATKLQEIDSLLSQRAPVLSLLALLVQKYKY